MCLSVSLFVRLRASVRVAGFEGVGIRRQIGDTYCVMEADDRLIALSSASWPAAANSVNLGGAAAKTQRQIRSQLRQNAVKRSLIALAKEAEEDAAK